MRGYQHYYNSLLSDLQWLQASLPSLYRHWCTQTVSTMEFTNKEHRQDIVKVIDAFQKHCIGEVNVSYEHYIFNRRVQEIGESVDAFIANSCHLACSCEYRMLENLIMHDCIIIGIHNDTTHQMLLQTWQLDLNKAAAKQVRWWWNS